MNMHSEIKRARDHLAALQREQASYCGPCTSCRFGAKSEYESDRKCSHPLIVGGKLDAITGEVKWRTEYQKNMRADGGLCGPSGQLYERAAIHVRFWRWLPWWVLLPIAFVSFMAILVLIVSVATAPSPHS